MLHDRIESVKRPPSNLEHDRARDSQRISDVQQSVLKIEGMLREILAAQGRFESQFCQPPQRTVFDVGVNHGEDSRFYLDKGFIVVGIEANPIIAEELKSGFAADIAEGRFVLLNIGIWSDEGTLPFYRNLANDHWSSFDKNYGCRDGTPYEEIGVPCITPEQLFARYGIPYYLKIDVEGADRIILQHLAGRADLPIYISVEEYGFAAIDDLNKVGYRYFKIRPQRRKNDFALPYPAKEGLFVDRTFTGRDSGPFGRELGGRWMDYTTARKWFIENIRTENGTYIGPSDEWYDVHATTELAPSST